MKNLILVTSENIRLLPFYWHRYLINRIIEWKEWVKKIKNKIKKNKIKNNKIQTAAAFPIQRWPHQTLNIDI